MGEGPGVRAQWVSQVLFKKWVAINLEGRARRSDAVSLPNWPDGVKNAGNRPVARWPAVFSGMGGSFTPEYALNNCSREK